MIQKFIYPEFNYGSVSLKEKVGQTFVKVYSSDICNGKILRLAILYVTVYRKQIFRLRLTDKLQLPKIFQVFSKSRMAVLQRDCDQRSES